MIEHYPLMALLFVVAAGTVGALVPWACRFAHRFDFLDRPGGRKKHDDEIPPVGGLVVFPVFMLLVFLSGHADSSFGAFALSIFLLLGVGALDDRLSLPAGLKFLTQFIAAGIVVIFGGVQVVSFGNIFGWGEMYTGWVGMPFTIVAIVLLINAINLMDGLDGLAGGLGFVVCLGLLICALVAGDIGHAILLCAIMGALAGFLFHNMRTPWRSQARVFMGDAGSLSLGLSLGWLAIDMAGNPADAVAMPMTVAWLLGLPIMDTCSQFARRVSQGRHPFDPDHNHFHHHFVTAGVPVKFAVPAILLVVVLYGAFALGVQFTGQPQAWLTYPWIVLLFAHMYMSVRPKRFRKMIQYIFRIKASHEET